MKGLNEIIHQENPGKTLGKPWKTPENPKRGGAEGLGGSTNERAGADHVI